MATLYVSDLDGTLIRDDLTLSRGGPWRPVRASRRGRPDHRGQRQERDLHPRDPRRHPLPAPDHRVQRRVPLGVPDGAARDRERDPRQPLAREVFDALTAAGCEPYVSSFDGARDLVFYREIANEGMAAYFAERVAFKDERLRRVDDLAATLDGGTVCLTVIERSERLEPVQASLAAAFGDRVMLTSYDYRYFPGWKFFTVHDRRATKDQAIAALRKSRGLEEARADGVRRRGERPRHDADRRPADRHGQREARGEGPGPRDHRIEQRGQRGAPHQGRSGEEGRTMNPAANDRARPATVRPPSYRAAIVMNLVAVACWAVAPTFVKVINRSFPSISRTSGATSCRSPCCGRRTCSRADRSRVRADLAEIRRLARKILVIALVQYAFQFTYTFSLTLIYPGLMTLVQQSSAIFGALLAVAFFPDERRVVRDRMFLTGAVFAVSGALLVVLGGGSWGSAEFNVGVLSALAGALAWALLGTLIKRWVPHVPPLLSISSVFTILVPLFLASYAVANRGLPVPAAPPIDWVLMIVSGLLGVGIGQSLFYRAVPVIGVATSTSIGLLIPLLATIVSWLVFGERLSAIQIVGGVVLIAGSWFVIRLRLSLKS